MLRGIGWRGSGSGRVATVAIEEIRIDGKRLEARWVGAPAADRPTIVLLHEALGSTGLWKDFPERLSAQTGCPVLAYSRQGHGHAEPLTAPRPLDYLEHEATIVLPAVLAHYGLERPILFGHSDGASIALIHAGSFPGVAAGLILEAPHVFVEELTIAGIEAATDAYRTTDLRQRLARHHQDVDRIFHAWSHTWLDTDYRAWNIEALLPQIRCPILVIQGEGDQYGTAIQLEAIARATPATRTVLMADCGHSPHRDQPAAVLDETAGFVAALLNGSASGPVR
jgi:pimeloyl-ACP methyl ester carboxylesterase